MLVKSQMNSNETRQINLEGGFKMKSSVDFKPQFKTLTESKCTCFIGKHFL